MPFFGGPPDIQKLKGNRDIKGLRNALNNKDPETIREAAFAMAEFGIFVQSGLALGLGSKDARIREKAYLLYAKFLHFGFPTLIAALHDPEFKVRVTGIAGLVEYTDKRAIHPLGECLLYDEDERIRLAAAVTLSKFMVLDNKQVLEYLIAARNDTSTMVNVAVNQVLSTLGY